MANQEQLIFGAIVVGVALLYLNSGKDLSAAALAAGPDGDTPPDARIRAEALEALAEELRVNQGKQAKWAAKCKAELQTERQVNGGEGAPEGRILANSMAKLKGLLTQGNMYLNSLLAIVRRQKGLVRPAEAWKIDDVERDDFRHQLHDLEQVISSWNSDITQRTSEETEGRKQPVTPIWKVVNLQNVQQNQTQNVHSNTNMLIDRTTNMDFTTSQAQTLNITRGADPSVSPFPRGPPRTLPVERARPNPSQPDPDDPVRGSFVSPGMDKREAITDGAATDEANRRTNPPPRPPRPGPRGPPPMTGYDAARPMREANYKRYLKEKAEGQMTRRDDPMTFEEWAAANQQGGAGGGSEADARATDQEDARRAREELDAKQRGRVAPKRKPEEGEPAAAFNQSRAGKRARADDDGPPGPGTGAGPQLPTVEPASADAKRNDPKRSRVGVQGERTLVQPAPPPTAVDGKPPLAPVGAGDGSKKRREPDRVTDAEARIEQVNAHVRNKIEEMDAMLGGIKERGLFAWEDKRSVYLRTAWIEILRMSSVNYQNTNFVLKLLAGRDPKDGLGPNGEPVGTGQYGKEYTQWVNALNERKKQFEAVWLRYVGEGKVFNAKAASQSRKGYAKEKRKGEPQLNVGRAQGWLQTWTNEFAKKGSGFTYIKRSGLGSLKFNAQKK